MTKTSQPEGNSCSCQKYKERKESGCIKEEGQAVKCIERFFKQVPSERIMMNLLFFPELLIRWSQTCMLARNPDCRREIKEITPGNSVGGDCNVRSQQQLHPRGRAQR